jgi:Tfp pilus assembly protein PilN
MIRVNLLPQEYRKAEATPLKQFFSVIGAAVIVTIAAVAWLWVRFGMLDQAEKDRDNAKAAVEAQQAQLKQVADLEAWVAEYKGRYEKIDQVAQNRLVLSRKFDELWEIVVSPMQTNRYEVWLQNLSFTLAPTAKTGGSVQFAGTSAGQRWHRASDFHEDLMKSDYYRDFADITYPHGTKIELTGKNREPKEGWTFNFTSSFKALKDLYENRAKVAAAAESGKK